MLTEKCFENFDKRTAFVIYLYAVLSMHLEFICEYFTFVHGCCWHAIASAAINTTHAMR